MVVRLPISWPSKLNQPSSGTLHYKTDVQLAHLSIAVWLILGCRLTTIDIHQEPFAYVNIVGRPMLCCNGSVQIVPIGFSLDVQFLNCSPSVSWIRLGWRVRVLCSRSWFFVEERNRYHWVQPNSKLFFQPYDSTHHCFLSDRVTASVDTITPLLTWLYVHLGSYPKFH